MGAVGYGMALGTILRTDFSPVPSLWYHMAYTFDETVKRQAPYVNGLQIAAGLRPDRSVMITSRCCWAVIRRMAHRSLSSTEASMKPQFIIASWAKKKLPGYIPEGRRRSSCEPQPELAALQ